MAATPRYVQVKTHDQMQATISGYLVQGFVITGQTPASVTLMKRKQFNVVWALVGAFLCLLPLLLYLVYYATQSDEVVQIQVVSDHDSAPATTNMSPPHTHASDPGPRQLSPDGRYWWDGSAWHPVAEH